MTATEKYEALLTRLATLDSVLVAFSGGIDSTLLAYAAHAELGDRFTAVLANSDTYPDSEIVTARELAAQLGFELIEVETEELADPNYTANGPDRCYHCKGELFGLLQRVAAAEGLSCVADGSNADDLNDYRPGRQAAQELGVISPLADVGLTKSEIRELAHEFALPNADKPAMACLGSRFPYNEPITPEGLRRLSEAEESLRSLGLLQFRVRSHGEVARIEVVPSELEFAWASREEISRAVHGAGFHYASIDLDGYRSGSMNEIL